MTDPFDEMPTSAPTGRCSARAADNRWIELRAEVMGEVVRPRLLRAIPGQRRLGTGITRNG